MPSRLPVQDKLALTRKVLQVLADWDLEPMVQCELLGLPPSDAGRAFRRLRLGNSLPDDREVWTRVALLLRLDNAVHQLFPHCAYSANLWVTSPNPRCANKTPLDIMLEDGLAGIRRIELALDNVDPLTLLRTDLVQAPRVESSVLPT